MNTYQLRDGDTLVLAVDGGPWETATFVTGDFHDIRQASADEVAKVIDRLSWATASANDRGALELATRSRGGQARLEVDLAASSAAGALGLTTAQAKSHGSGLIAASLVGRNSAPFALPKKAAMKLVVDGTAHEIKFQSGTTSRACIGRGGRRSRRSCRPQGRARNARRPRRDDFADNRLWLDLEVQPPDASAVDAAAILGFVGLAAISRPYDASPARIICGGHRTSMRLVNPTGGPIELHLSSGSTLLPARQTLPVPASELASDSLQRLVAQGQVRLMADERD